MFELTLENVGSIREGVIGIPEDGITLIAGDNKAGKSTVCATLACALLHNSRLFGSSAESAAKAMVGSWMDVDDEKHQEASASLRSDYETVRLHWRLRGGKRSQCESADVKDVNKLTRSSRIACGLDVWSSLDKTARSLALATAYNADPTDDELRDALKGIKASLIDDAVGRIHRNGWPIAAEHFSDLAKQTEGRWRQVTKDNYGSNKAVEWVPNGWSRDLEGKELFALQEAAEAAEKEWRKAEIAAGVDHAKLAEDKETARASAGIDQRLSIGEVDLQTARTRLQEMQTELADLRPRKGRKSQNCPSCGVDLIIVGDEILNAPTDAEIEALDARYLAHKELVRAQEEEVETLANTVTKVRAEKAAAQEAMARIRAAQEAPTGDVGDPVTLESAYREAKARAEMVQQKNKADKLHGEAVEFRKVALQLGDKGLRLKKIRETLATVNADLAKYSQAIPHGTYSLTDEFALECGGRSRLSGSETWLGDVIMAIVIGTADNSSMIVIDAADILTKKRRGRLISRLVRGLPIPVVVATAAPDWLSVPNLESKGLGVAYWIQDGIIQSIATMAQETKESANPQ